MSSVVDINTGEICYIGDCNLEGVEYPHDWFRKNPGEKPPITVGVVNHIFSEFSSHVHNLFINGELTTAVLKSYLYAFLSKEREICADDWESMGIKIAKRGEQVGPMDLLNVKEETLDIDLNQHKGSTHAEKLVANILTVRRVCQISGSGLQTNQIIALEEKLKRLYRSDLYLSLAQGRTMYDGKWCDVGFNRMFAVIDMYYHRFPNSRYAQLRMGTEVSRFRSCVVLEWICNTIEKKGLDSPAELKEWIWVPLLRAEFHRIYKEDIREISVVGSYLPYFMDLGLSNKSPYSVKLNSGVHLFCQSALVCDADPRAINAKFITIQETPQNIQGIIQNAFMFSYATIAGKDPRILDTASAPKSRHPCIWFKYFCRSGGLESEEFKKYFKVVKSRITNPRVGSLGEYFGKQILLFSSKDVLFFF